MRKQERGFRTMSKKKRSAIARKGGIAAHEKGTAHEWTKKEARAAGRKGGRASHGGRGKNWKPRRKRGARINSRRR